MTQNSNSMIDNLETCPKCKALESCYSTEINEVAKQYVCLSCGFTASDLFLDGEYDANEYEKEMPELFKDIKYVDEDERVWYPHVINIEGKGTVFPNGSSKYNWHWAAIKSVPLTEEEKESPRFKGKQYKSDPKTMQKFDEDYFAACDYIGFFDIDPS